MSSKQKKKIRVEVAQTLMTTFSKFDNQLSPKKFKRNIKKATKALVAGIKPEPESKPLKVKKEKKKEQPTTTITSM